MEEEFTIVELFVECFAINAFHAACTRAMCSASSFPSEVEHRQSLSPVVLLKVAVEGGSEPSEFCDFVETDLRVRLRRLKRARIKEIIQTHLNLSDSSEDAYHPDNSPLSTLDPFLRGTCSSSNSSIECAPI